LAFGVTTPINTISDLQLGGSSDNATLVPNANIAFTKNNTTGDCTVTVTPAHNQQGSATITLTVTNIASTPKVSSAMSFKVIVGAPTISAIPNQITAISMPTPAIPVTITDAEGDTLTITTNTSNPRVVTLADIAMGGSGSSRTITVTPEAGQSGVAWITISVTDGYNTNTTSFAVTVTPAALGLVYNENFAYNQPTEGPLYLNSGGSGGGWSHVSGPSGEIQVTNTGTSGFAYLVHTNNEDLGSAFIGGNQYNGTNGYVFYTGFTVNFSLLPSYYGDYFFHFATNALDGAGFSDKLFANSANAATGKFRLGIANTAGTMNAQNPLDLVLGQTYSVVTRYNAATGDSTLWVNPLNEQSPSVTASDNPGSSIIGGVALRQTGCCIGDLAIGPMKVGTQFADVAVAVQSPGISIQPQSQTNNAGATVTFLVNATGTGPIGYQWLKDQTNTIAGATNTVLSLSNVQSNDVAGYSVLVTNAYGSATSSVATLTVLFPPVIVQQPQDRAGAAGGTAQFSVSVTGNTNRTYQWQLSEADMLGRTNNALLLTNIQPSDFGGYRVIVRNPDGSATSQVAHLTVAVQPQLAPPHFNAATLYLAIPTEFGPVYVLEYKTALDDLFWQELTFLNGTGGTLPVTDNNPTNSARFYRVRMR
jgi:hypothetical protein